MGGLIHLYVGDGKGKTTAAAGLAARMLGHGGRVLFCQFLKDGSSGELESLRGLGAETAVAPHNGRFTVQMTPREREETRLACTAFLREMAERAGKESPALLVLDEVVDAVNTGMIPQEDVLALARSLPAGTELVMTGRDPAEELCGLADYHTEFVSRAHPYQKGVSARKGIEW